METVDGPFSDRNLPKNQLLIDTEFLVIKDKTDVIYTSNNRKLKSKFEFNDGITDQGGSQFSLQENF
jgi:hypothetical protein